MKKSILSLLFAFVFFNFLPSQTIKSMDFRNQNIVDILLALGEQANVSIIADETVSGQASFFFSDSSLENALDYFLSTYNLFYERDNDLIKVSKIKIQNTDNNTLSIKADNVPVESIFRSISKKVGKTVLYDSIPNTYLSLDCDKLSVSEILNICIHKYPDYTIEDNSTYYYIKHISDNNNSKRNLSKNDYLIKNNGLYTLNLDKGRLFDVLKKLFDLEGKEYSSFIQTDVHLENLYFSNKSLDSLLKLILEHINADYIEKEDIYYIVDVPKKGVQNKLKITEIIPLKWIPATTITTLIPAEFSNTVSMKVDKNTNNLIITGIKDEVNNIIDFVAKIDVKPEKDTYKIIDIKYLDAKDVISLIPEAITKTSVSVIPKLNSILAVGTPESLEQIEEFVSKIDNKKEGIPIQLKYIQTDTLLKNLPPSISKEYIVTTGYPNLLFFTGSEDNKDIFLRELELIDKPQPQIKYQLLVIQYSKGKSLITQPSFKVQQSDQKDSLNNFIFNGELSNIMNLNFDIISLFGYQFAASLNTQIGNSTANVFTDTTLTGISGQDIKFQNTDTYRYIEHPLSSSSTVTTSTTQQITSGLIVGLNGWISGNNMITMNINATISKTNTDSNSNNSSSLTTLPSTSERVVMTQVRSKSGEPIVISGLIKEDEVERINKTPILGDIPLLRVLFRHKNKTKEKTEIVIYIVPHLIQEYSNDDSDAANIEHYYNTFIKKQDYEVSFSR